MSTFKWMFDKDRFTVYKTWRRDSSIVYRLTTWTNTMAHLGNLLRLGVKTNVIFLKVQKPGFIPAYDALKRAGLKLDPAARDGLSNTVGSMAVQKTAFWQTTSGNDIMGFCRRNAKWECRNWAIRGSSRLFELQMAENLGRKT